jgi:hypothetical protein
MSPSGSNAPIGTPFVSIIPQQLGDRKSQNLIVLSSAQVMKKSSVGETARQRTRSLCPSKTCHVFANFYGDYLQNGEYIDWYAASDNE